MTSKIEDIAPDIEHEGDAPAFECGLMIYLTKEGEPGATDIYGSGQASRAIEEEESISLLHRALDRIRLAQSVRISMGNIQALMAQASKGPKPGELVSPTGDVLKTDAKSG